MAKRFEYIVTIDREGGLCAEGEAPLELTKGWTPEHLVLAGLARCTLTSLRFYAERAGLRASGSAGASGVVTRRQEDGRFAFVEVLCGLDVEIEPAPDDAGALVDLAEHGCFVSASLTVKVEYEWRVNGELLSR